MIIRFSLIILGTVLTGFIFYLLSWRWLSKSHHLPCPPGFLWLLEHPFFSHLSGSALIIERADIHPGMRVLDAGSGPGRISLPLSKHLGPQGEVVALDIQAPMLEILKKRQKEAGIENITTQLGALGNNLLVENHFDRALLITVLGEIPNQKAALKEIYHALKPGGILSITEVLPDPHFQTRKTIFSLAEKTGFTTELVYSDWRSFTINLTKPG